MPAVDIISQFLHPPFGLLRPVLDEAGPYGPGSSTRTTFDTSTSFLAFGAGTYSVTLTYGIVAILNGTIPPAMGYSLNWVDPVGLTDAWRYEDQLAQIVVQHAAIGGALLNTQIMSCHYLQQAMLFDFALPTRIGIWVAPPVNFDLFYLCLP